MIEIKTVPINTVVPYWRNPRNNSETAIEMVAKSIEAFGYQSPILVDKENVIIAGHTRYKALKKLGVDEVEVIVSDMDEHQAKEFRIIDNRTTEFSNWIIDNVLAEYAEIPTQTTQDVFFPQKSVDEPSEPEKPQDGQNTPVQGSVESSPSQDQLPDRYEFDDEDYIELLCPSCMSGFELTFGEFKQLLEGDNG